MTGWREGVLRAAGRLTSDQQGLLVVLGAVVAANLLYLLGIFNPDPLGPASHLLSARTTGLLGGSNYLDPNIGYTSQALGHRAVLDLLSGHLPWWNPYEATGVPLAGEMQSAALFPPTLLLGVANGQVWEHMLLELVSGCSTYLLLRRLSLVRLACIAGAIGFALNGTSAWFAHAAANPVAFAPVVLLGVEMLADAARSGRRGGWWLLAVGIALSCYAGFPETAYLNGLLGAVWFGWRWSYLPRPRRRALLAKGAAGAAVGLLLSAPILIPFVDYLHSASVGAHSGAETAPLPHGSLPQFLLPYVYGPITAFKDPSGTLGLIWGRVGGFVTASITLFAIVGLRVPGRNGLRWVLAGWLLLAFSRIYGVPPLLGHVLGVLPGMSSVQFFRLGETSVELSMIILAAIGINSLGGDPEWRRRLISSAGIAALLAIGAALDAGGMVGRLLPTVARISSPTPNFYLYASVAAALVFIAVAALPAARCSAGTCMRIATAALAVEALLMFALPELSAPRRQTSDTRAVSYLNEHLDGGRFFTMGPVRPNYGSYYGVASLNNNDLPLPANWYAYVHKKLDPVVNPFHFIGDKSGGRPASAPTSEQELISHLAAYRTAGVDYVVTPPATLLPHPLAVVFKSADAWIYRLPGAAPFYSANGCRIIATSLEGVRLSCPVATLLTRRETYMPGWTATVDGGPARVSETGGLFEAVTVPAGTHELSFDFAPPHIVAALLAFLVGIVWLLLGQGQRRVAARFVGARRWALDRIRRAPEPGPPVPETVPARAPVDGRVEGVGSGVVTGWLWRPGAPGERLQVHVLLDDRLVAGAAAELDRPSLRQAGIGDGRHGFRIHLDYTTLDAGTHTLQVRSDDGTPLAPAAGFVSGLDGPSARWTGTILELEIAPQSEPAPAR